MNIKIKCQGHKCSGIMVQRKNRLKGNYFYGCSRYPRCKETLTVAQYEIARNSEGLRRIGEVEEWESWEFSWDDW